MSADVLLSNTASVTAINATAKAAGGAFCSQNKQKFELKDAATVTVNTSTVLDSQGQGGAIYAPEVVLSGSSFQVRLVKPQAACGAAIHAG